MRCCCCCCCYIGKSFRHSWYIQYGRFIDIVLISLLFSQFCLLDALWLTKSSKLFKTLYCTQNFLPMKIWKFVPLFITSPAIPPKPTSFFFLPGLFLTFINNTLRVSRYLLIILFQSKLKSHELILSRSNISAFAFKQRVPEGFRSRLYLVSFF